MPKIDKLVPLTADFAKLKIFEECMTETLLYKGDCLELMNNIKDKSIDLILCDLPFGTTAHKWDSVLPYDLLWKCYNRIIKDDGIIALFATQPFTSTLICSNLGEYRYNWIWEKESPNGFLNSSYAPLKKTEDICIFSKCTVGSLSKNPIRFYVEKSNQKIRKNNPKSKLRSSSGYSSMNNKLNSDEEYISSTNCLNNILKYKRDSENYHPTQKPIELLKKLIKIYTKEDEWVLDNCFGSGSTGVACYTTNRNFIGIEKDDKYFEIGKDRINKVKESLFDL